MSGSAPAPGLIAPVPDDETADFCEGTALGELRVQACGACGRLRFPPRVMCPACHSTQRHWRAVSGSATIWSFVIAHPPLLPAYAELAPYNVITVTLEEDAALRMVGNLVPGPDGAINEIDPASIVIGEAVHVVFSGRPRPDGTTIYLPEWARS
jgi:uncharacterized OB-fold protein